MSRRICGVITQVVMALCLAGVITNLAGDPRVLQLSLRIAF